MRKTQSGDLIVKLTKRAKAEAATMVVSEKLSAALPGAVIECLRQTTEVEIIDLDEMTNREEVNAALKRAIGNDPSLGFSDEAHVTGLWYTKYGLQMATATVP